MTNTARLAPAAADVAAQPSAGHPRKLDPQSRRLLTDSRTILINPTPEELSKALTKVQRRASTNLLTLDEALTALREVVQGGCYTASAGLKSSPIGFRFGVSSTVVDFARLGGALIACSIGRRQVRPGETGRPLIRADPFEYHRQWAKDVVTAFWTHLDDQQIAQVQCTASSIAMQLSARDERRSTHAQTAERAGVRRRLQLQALFKNSQPTYVSELAGALRHIAGELAVEGRGSGAFHWTEADFAGGTVLDLWNCRSKDQFIAQGVLHPRTVTMEHLKLEADDPCLKGMSPKVRQWYQCHSGWPGGGDFYCDVEGMAAAMSGWRWPLHFIDFEICAVAIPFDSSRRPYETIAFQFSHHILHADGRVEHRGQFLEATPGVDPCLPFLRALRASPSTDGGTIFRWAAHENTVLNQLRRRLLADMAPPADRDELVVFIESITTREQGDGKDKIVITGPRSMVDLCKLAERHYFHPLTKGSSSLKKVLPALMQSSPRLRKLYEAPSYGGPNGIPSLNFREPVAWWVQGPNGSARDPYDLLPPVFADLSREEQERLETGLAPELQEGGAAMTAFARMQFEDIDEAERNAICDALLKYCELDTLAMVMAVQGWRD